MNHVCTWLSIKEYHFCYLNNIHILSRCHGPISPPNSEFTLKPTKKKMGKHIECTPGTPCPPCKEVVLVSCFGQHLGQERAVSFWEQCSLLIYLLPPAFSLTCVAHAKIRLQNTYASFPLITDAMLQMEAFSL